MKMSGKWMSLDRALVGATLILQAGIIGWLGYDKWSERRASERPVQTVPSSFSRPSAVTRPAASLTSRPVRLRHDPFDVPFFASAADMHRQMNRMMADALQTFEQFNEALYMDHGWDTLPASPTMDMRVLGDRYEVTFSLPGCNPSNVSVNLEGRLLTVASSSDEQSPSHRQAQRFESRVQLPGPVGDAQKARVEFTNGMLRVTVPRATGSENTTQRVKLI